MKEKRMSAMKIGTKASLSKSNHNNKRTKYIPRVQGEKHSFSKLSTISIHRNIKNFYGTYINVMIKSIDPKKFFP